LHDLTCCKALLRYRLQNPLAKTRITARIIKTQPHATTSVPSNMASPSQRATQVSLKPIFCIFHLFLARCVYACNSPAYHLQLINIKAYIPHRTRKQSDYATMGPTLRSKIGREAKRPPKSLKQNSKANLSLTMNYIANTYVQDYDQDMVDSNSPQSNKRGQLSNQLTNQQMKTRSDLQSEHERYTSQDI
jgi:hypothetical protein